jgi:hypothetical protein
VSRHITRNLGKKIGGRVKLSPAAMEATHDIDFVLWCLSPRKPVHVYAQEVRKIMGPDYNVSDCGVGAAFISIASDISLVEIYNPATDIWEPPGARMPTARSAVASAVYNGKIYVAGGEWQDPVVQTAFRVFEAYDPATNTWSVLPPMTTPRHGVAGAVIGNRFYAVSGDVQSSGTGVAVSTPAATAFEFSR